MTIPDDLFTTPGDSHDAEVKRDRWGRPIIDGKGRTRASSVAKPLEDTFNLEQWHRRNVAYGIATDSSLVARILAIGGDPAEWSKDDKKAVDEVITAANTAAKSHRRADIGTALHRLMERVDHGEDVNAGPYAADIDAYRQAMAEAGLVALPEFVEVFMYNADADTAGTCDNIALQAGRHVVADKKTGSTVDFGALGFGAQLAAYAGGVIWDYVNDKPLPTPDIDQDTGYIIHVPAGEGRCNIYEVDLAGGREAIQLANAVRNIRSRSRKWLTQIAAPSTPSLSVDVEQPGGGEAERTAATVAPPPTLDEQRNRYKALSDADKALVSDYWERNDTDLTDPAAIAESIDAVTNFHDITTTPAPAPVPTPATPRPDTSDLPDEGPPIPAADFTALSNIYRDYPKPARDWIAQIGIEAKRAGLDFHTKGHRTTRRFHIMRALINLSDHPDRDTVVDRLLRDIHGDTLADHNPTGILIGALNHHQAVTFADTATEAVT